MVNLNLNTGLCLLNPLVLEEMRRYLLLSKSVEASMPKSDIGIVFRSPDTVISDFYADQEINTNIKRSERLC